MKLGDFWVEISAKGVEATNRAIDVVGKKLDGLAHRGGLVGIAFSKIGSVIPSALSGIASGASLAVGGIAAIATAGIHASVQGQRMAWSFERLSLAVGSLFLPVVEAATKMMDTMTGYFNSLSQAQVDNLLKWGGLAAGVALFNTGIGKIPGTILLVTQGFKALSDASGSVKWLGLIAGVTMMATGIGTIPGALLAATSGLSMFADKGTEGIKGITSAVDNLIDKMIELWDTLKYVMIAMEAAMIASGQYKNAAITTAGLIAADIGIQKARGMRKRGEGIADLIPQGAGGEGRPKLAQGGYFESLTSTYGRIQEAIANKFDPALAARDQKKETEKSNELLDKIRAAVEGAGFRVPALVGP